MTPATALRDRLWDRCSGAAIAIALQAGLLALLVFSFEVVRHVAAEKETILILPPPAKIVPRRPLVIDARGRKPSGAAMPQAAPAHAPPPFAVTAPPDGGALRGGALLQALGRDIAKCGPANYGALNASERKACAQDRPRDDTTAPYPKPPVKNAPIWQSEIERRNTPPRVPCVSLTNSVVGMDGFARQDHGARLDVGCALKAWREGPALLPPVHGAPDPDPLPAHASDDAFGKALQAVNTRKRVLYARAAPPPDAIAGASP